LEVGRWEFLEGYFFFAAFFLAPFAAFLAMWNPSLQVDWIASVSPISPAHSAAWHVGPGVNELARWLAATAG
jgi:hypothetical protein